MGNFGSKNARAVGSVVRQYPGRASSQPGQASRPRQGLPESSVTSLPTGDTSGKASSTRSQAIDLDARDPYFASRLSELGPVTPFPAYSPPPATASTASYSASSSRTSTITNPGSTGTTSVRSGGLTSSSVNPAVAILAARKRIQDAAEQEKVAAGRAGFQGKEFLDIATIRKVLALRDERGMSADEIETTLGLRTHVLQKLGRVGVLEAA